jgi:hypothetical protein
LKAPKEKIAAAVRETKCRLDNPLTEAQKGIKVVAEAERQRTIQKTMDKQSKRASVTDILPQLNDPTIISLGIVVMVMLLQIGRAHV